MFHLIGQFGGQAAVDLAFQPGFRFPDGVIRTGINRQQLNKLHALTDNPEVFHRQTENRFFFDVAGVIQFVVAVTGTGFEIKVHQFFIDGAVTVTGRDQRLVFIAAEAVIFIFTQQGQVVMIGEVAVKLQGGGVFFF